MRMRISTTVDPRLLEQARSVHKGAKDAELLDAAFAALIKQSRSAEIDATYEVAYDKHPISEPDEWGNLEDFHQAVASS